MAIARLDRGRPTRSSGLRKSARYRVHCFVTEVAVNEAMMMMMIVHVVIVLMMMMMMQLCSEGLWSIAYSAVVDDDGRRACSVKVSCSWCMCRMIDAWCRMMCVVWCMMLHVWCLTLVWCMMLHGVWSIMPAWSLVCVYDLSLALDHNI